MKSNNPESITSIYQTFNDKFEAFQTIATAQNADAATVSKAFKNIFPDIKKLKKHVEQLKRQGIDPTGYLITFITAIDIKIGLSFLYNKEYTKARPHLTAAADSNTTLVAYIHLARLESLTQNPKGLAEAGMRLLEAALQGKHAAETLTMLDKLKNHALVILQYHVLNPSIKFNFKKFLTQYSKFLGIDGYTTLIALYEHNPQEQAKWRTSLFSFLASNPSIDCPNVHDYIVQQADYYLTQKQYLQCVVLIEKNLSLFVALPSIISGLAFLLLNQIDNYPELPSSTLKTWLMNAAATHNEDALFRFLLLLHNNETSFSFYSQKAFDLVSKVCEQEIQFQRRPWLATECLGIMYLHGQGTTVDYPQALALFEKAHYLGSRIASMHWSEVLIFQTSLPKDIMKKQLSKALSMLSDGEARVAQAEITAKIRANFTHRRAQCLLYLGNLETEDFETMLSLGQNFSHRKFLQVCPSANNPAAILNLEFSLKNGDPIVQTDAAFLLAMCYLVGATTDKNPSLAAHYSQEALKLYKTYEDDDSLREYFFLLVCGLTVQQQHENETNIPKKKTLQFQALNYFHHAFSLQASELPPEIRTIVDRLYQERYYPQTVRLTSSQISHSLRTLQAHSQTQGKIQLSQLLMNDPTLTNTPETLGHITQAIEAIDEHFLDNRELLVKLGEFVNDCVKDAPNWDISTTISVFANVRKWHLVSATKALEALLVHLQLLWPALTFKQWCESIQWIAQCNFSPEIQNVHLPLLLQSFQTKFLIQESMIDFSITDAARLFYALALLDSNQTHPIYISLAEQLLTALKPKIGAAGHCEISELFHAYHYFHAYYSKPNSWSLGAELRKRFADYRIALCANTIVSKSQQSIYTLLQEIFPPEEIKQEALIAFAGRRVDFLIGTNLIIQYNGTWHHNMWNDQGAMAHDTLKEQLCYKTLTAADPEKNYVVIRIKRTTLSALKNNDDRLAYLRDRINQVSHLIKMRADVEPTETKVARITQEESAAPKLN